MNSLETLPISLELYESVKRGGGALGNYTRALAPTWARSIRRVGGFWMGSCTYRGPREQLEEMFIEGMMREIRETTGGQITWQGFLAEMTLTENGAQYVRRWSDIANAVKCIFTRIFDNMLTNGSAESGAWTAKGSPTTCEQSTTWVTDGNYSCHLVADHANDGAVLQSSIAINASMVYELRISVKVISGTWKVSITRDDTGETLGGAQTSDTGESVLSAHISDNSSFAGNISVSLYCTTAAGEAYGDGAVFCPGQMRAETQWFTDAASIVDYGRMEDVILEAAMDIASALGLAQRSLYERRWARTTAPEELAIGQTSGEPDQLEMTFYGYAFTLRNKYTLQSDTQASSTLITNLVGESEFVTAGIISSNTQNYIIDNRGPLRAWEVIQGITDAGDVSGNLWSCGVYGGRLLDYEPTDMTIVYRIKGNKLIDVSGGVVQPWLARPGVAYLDDMPIGPTQVTGNAADDPRAVYMHEVEFDCADWLAGGSGLIVRSSAESD